MTARRLLALLLALLFSAACLTPVFAQDSEAPKEAPKKKKKKKDEYESSKYRSFKVLADGERTYRFDAQGNPIPTEAEKKKAKKKAVKKKSEDEDAPRAACAETETCEDEGTAKAKPKVSSEGSDF